MPRVARLGSGERPFIVCEMSTQLAERESLEARAPSVVGDPGNQFRTLAERRAPSSHSWPGMAEVLHAVLGDARVMGDLFVAE